MILLGCCVLRLAIVVFVILLCLLFVVVLVRLVCVYASWFATFLVAGWFRCLD